jgi:hypothetical protein
MAGAAPSDDASSMRIQPNMTQRDLVRLALLTCGERSGEKYRRPAKGTQNSSNADPSRGFGR